MSDNSSRSLLPTNAFIILFQRLRRGKAWRLICRHFTLALKMRASRYLQRAVRRVCEAEGSTAFMSELYQLLPWDCDVFGFTTARTDVARLEDSIAAQRNAGVTLSYCQFPEDDRTAGLEERVVAAGGTLVDRRCTFVGSTDDILKQSRSGLAIHSYSGPLSEGLLSLAIDSGQHSRFQADPRFPRDIFVKLYTLWIQRSLKREIADDVYVSSDGDMLAGMVTVGQKRRRGDIGLIAVATAFRGQGLGMALVATAAYWAQRNRLAFNQVVTQSANVSACKLYTRAGYQLESVERIYHLWLNPRPNNSSTKATLSEGDIALSEGRS